MHFNDCSKYEKYILEARQSNFHCIFNMWTDRMTIILRIQQVHHLIFIYVLLGNLYKLIPQRMKNTNFVPLTEEFVIAHSWWVLAFVPEGETHSQGYECMKITAIILLLKSKN